MVVVGVADLSGKVEAPAAVYRSAGSDSPMK